MTSIDIRNLSKQYPSGAQALAGVDLQVVKGELLALVGPSGSGKSTLLRLIAGLESPTSGKIHLDGVDVTSLAPHRRDVALVFQDLALYTHLTVAGNLQFGGASQARVVEAAELVKIQHLLPRYPAELSGGEQQRVALARAIVRRPKVLLLDEPLSSVDGPLRRLLRQEIKQLQRELNVPAIYVTHDQSEALALGDRVAVLHEGKLLAIATAAEMYQRPQSSFLGEFFGTQGMNLLSGTLRIKANGAEFTTGAWRLEMPAALLPQRIENSPTVLCGFRPNDLIVGAGSLVGEVTATESQGDVSYVHLRVPASGDKPQSVIATCRRHEAPQFAAGEAVSLALDCDHLHWFHPDSGARL